jgi:tetratricopeptide (TPR) repeat protein
VINEDKLSVKPEKPDDKLVNLAAPPDDFTFYLNRDLPNQMSYLTHFTLGQIFYLQNQYDSALTLFQTALTFAPTQNPTKFQRSLAATYFYMGVIWQTINHNNDQSLQNYTKAIELNPWYTQAYNNRGLAYADQMNYEQALKDYTKSIELNPQLAQAYYNRGMVYYNQKNYDPAIQDYTKAIELDPKLAQAYNNRGVVYYNQKNYEQALKDYTKLIELDPQYTRAYYNRGLAYADQMNYDHAIKDYTKAIELDPQLAQAYYNRGNSYARLGNYSKAEADFDKAMQLLPDDSQSYNNKCWWGSLLGQATKVLTACDKAVELSDNNPGVRDSRGLARALTGEIGGAIADFQAFVDWSKENDMYEQSGKKREEWIKALQAGQNPFDEETLQALREE